MKFNRRSKKEKFIVKKFHIFMQFKIKRNLLSTTEYY